MAGLNILEHEADVEAAEAGQTDEAAEAGQTGEAAETSQADPKWILVGLAGRIENLLKQTVSKLTNLEKTNYFQEGRQDEVSCAFSDISRHSRRYTQAVREAQTIAELRKARGDRKLWRKKTMWALCQKSLLSCILFFFWQLICP